MPAPIALIKKSGYRADFVGAVEAASLVGGPDTLPVMRAVAFIMAGSVNAP